MDGTYNSYKSTKKEIINKDICRDKLLCMAKTDFKGSIIGLIVALTIGVGFVVIFSFSAANTVGSIWFVASLLAIFLSGFMIAMLVLNFIITAIDIKKIKSGNFSITEETVDYKTVEYVYKYTGGKYRRRILVTEYVIYFKELGRYVDSNDEFSIFNTSQPEDKFRIVCIKGKKPRYPIVFDQRHYQWED